MRGEIFQDQQAERGVRQSGAAEVDTTSLFQSVRSSATEVSGAFTADTRANRLAAVGMLEGDRWFETDTGWEYYYDGLSWRYLSGINTGTDAARGAITPASADAGALFLTTDSSSSGMVLWEVVSTTWTKRLQVQGTADQIAVSVASGVMTLSLVASPDVATSYEVGGTKVIGARGAAVADASGGATVDVEARTALNLLLARVRAHGLIST